MARRSFNRWSGFWIPISRWICWSDRLDIIAPDFTFEAHADTYLWVAWLTEKRNWTYHWGMPTHSSSQATMVAPFHSEKGVPSTLTFSTSSCFFFCRRCCSLNFVIDSLSELLLTDGELSYRQLDSHHPTFVSCDCPFWIFATMMPWCPYCSSISRKNSIWNVQNENAPS